MIIERFWNRKIFFIATCLLFVLRSPANAQLNSERTALNRLLAGKLESSYRILRKSLAKDSANLEANYVIARWFLTAGNPDFQVDSAHRYAVSSLKLYKELSVRDRERVEKFPIDSLILQTFQKKIDSTAFEQAKRINTEESYLKFIASYPTASQHSSALELRDEVSFLDALKVNTPQSFSDYLKRYPQSHRAGEARDRYEKLLFEKITADKKLASYKSFLKDYPESPYAANVQKEIFERTTATGAPEDFFAYLHEYPQGHYATLTKNILYHLYKETDEPVPESILSDSLTQVIKLNSQFWIPFYKNGFFGFMDQTGHEMLAPQFTEINTEYKCGPVNDDIIVAGSGIYSRSGRKLAGPLTTITSIGSGFLKAERNHCVTLLHKSGIEIIDACHEEYKMIGNNFIIAKKADYWNLFTLTGRLLDIDNIQEVRELGEVIVITQLGKKLLTTVQQLAVLANGHDLYDDLIFDDVIELDKNLLLVRNGSLEGILNSKLQFMVPLDRHALIKTAFGLIKKNVNGSAVLGLGSELENKTWHRVSYHRDWLVLQAEGNLQLFSIPTEKIIESKADSIWFDHSLAFVQTNNAAKVYLSSTRFIDLQPDSKINFVASRDSVQFFYTENKSKRTLFGLVSGEPLFTTEFELVESLGSEFFVVAKGAKKGLLGRNGKPLVPIEMDAIVFNQGGHLSLLKNGKFGIFDLPSRKFINPDYERNLTVLDAKHLIAFKEGLYGLIGWDTKPITKFEFAEVVPWSETGIWVKKSSQWMLIDFLSQHVMMDRVRSFSWLRNDEEERLIIVRRENYFGVVSNRKNVVIPPAFHQIINLGTADEPFYFTEKNVEEAEIYVVLYYNKDGKLMRRHAYEGAEYEQILCDSYED